MKQKQKFFVLYLVTVVILVGGLGYYNFYTSTLLRNDYNSKLALYIASLLAASPINLNSLTLSISIDACH